MSDRENDVGFIIKLIHDDLGSHLNRQLTPDGITSAQAEVLRFLERREGERVTLRDLEKYLGVSNPTVVGLVRRLTEKGLVVSVRDPQDGRARNLFLSPRMREQEKQQRAMGKVKDTEGMLTRGFTEEERQTLIRLLRRVQQNLQER